MARVTYGAPIQGAGWVSTQHVKAYMSNPHVKVVAISSRKEESAKKLAGGRNLVNVRTGTHTIVLPHACLYCPTLGYNPTAGHDFCSCMTFAQHEPFNMLQTKRIRM